MESLFKDINAEQLSATLGIRSSAGKQQWLEGLKHWPQTTRIFQSRVHSFRTLQKAACNSCAAVPSTEEFVRVSELEEKIEPLLRESTAVEMESYGQICFRSSPWSALNSIPFALFALSLYKTWALPFLTICMPLVAAIIPFFFVKTMAPPSISSKITLQEYLKTVWRMYSGMGENVAAGFFSNIPGSTLLNQQTTSVSSLKKWMGHAWMLFTIGNTVYYPIQQAMHFKTIDEDCRDIGFAILELEQKARTWQRTWSAWWPAWSESWISISDAEHGGDPRIAFSWAITYPYWLKHLMRAIGRFETLICLARHPEIRSAHVLTNSTTPQLHCTEIADPFIHPTKAVRSTFHGGVGGEGGAGSNGQHSILTGPNRGGKSSILRAILTAVVMAHTYGAVFTRGSVSMTRFSWIANGLRLEDTPGKTSMFEREVAFARSIFQPHKGHGLVVYDECFHSTNPADSERTSTLFCSRLWRDPRCLSIVSTHVYKLAEEAPSYVQRICVPAEQIRRGEFRFFYTLAPGICRVSSVDALLTQYDFFVRSKEPNELPLKNKNEQSE